MSLLADFTSVARLDTPLKVNGSAMFSVDTRVPGMVYAAVVNNPVTWQPLKSYDFSAIADRPGVIAAVELTADPEVPDFRQTRTFIRSGVAVVADTWYRAKTAADLMPIEFDDGTRGNVSTESIYAAMYDVLNNPGFATEQMPSTRGSTHEELAALTGKLYLHRDQSGDHRPCGAARDPHGEPRLDDTIGATRWAGGADRSGRR